mmetsp:Transcript_12508/g.33138  ORF Transcript_12508/g.33138 Transcript_12508/m.33138 type:complete len:83 (+) Transcript_12508:561-809(+)
MAIMSAISSTTLSLVCLLGAAVELRRQNLGYNARGQRRSCDGRLRSFKELHLHIVNINARCRGNHSFYGIFERILGLLVLRQ